jgi:hypothetical protein
MLRSPRPPPRRIGRRLPGRAAGTAAVRAAGNAAEPAAGRVAEPVAGSAAAPHPLVSTWQVVAPAAGHSDRAAAGDSGRSSATSIGQSVTPLCRHRRLYKFRYRRAAPPPRPKTIKKWRGLMCRSSSSRGSGFPAGGDPRPADEAMDGDDGVGEVEERVDHLLPAFVAALQPVERVVPGIGALDVPTLAGQRWPAGLDRCLLALAGDLARQPTIGEGVAGQAPSRSRHPGAR